MEFIPHLILQKFTVATAEVICRYLVEFWVGFEFLNLNIIQVLNRFIY
jgi:hypothetical protein